MPSPHILALCTAAGVGCVLQSTGCRGEPPRRAAVSSFYAASHRCKVLSVLKPSLLSPTHSRASSPRSTCSRRLCKAPLALAQRSTIDRVPKVMVSQSQAAQPAPHQPPAWPEPQRRQACLRSKPAPATAAQDPGPPAAAAPRRRPLGPRPGLPGPSRSTPRPDERSTTPAAKGPGWPRQRQPSPATPPSPKDDVDQRASAPETARRGRRNVRV